MSLWCRTSAVWREIYNPQIRTSATWRMCETMYVRTSAVWRNCRPTAGPSLTIGNSGGKFPSYGYVSGVYGSISGNTQFGGPNVVSQCNWIGTALTGFRLNVASLGSTFVGEVRISTATCSSLTYSTGTGYSQWAGTWSTVPPTTGTYTLYVRGP